jgi:hypothetical protein
MNPLVSPIAIVGEAIPGKSQELRKRMRVLAGDIDKNTFDLAEAFAAAQESHCFMEWGFESLKEYASLELGVKPRRAQYLARIVKVCRECGIARKDYEPVGVTKLREITTLDPGSSFFDAEQSKHVPMVEYIVDLIAEGVELTAEEVEEKVAHLKGMTGGNAMVIRSYKVTRDAWEGTIAPALEAMRKLLGSKGRDETGQAKEYPDGTCIEYICREFLNDPNNFMEEPDESAVQIEVSEENNVSIQCSSSGAVPSMGSAEESQDSVQGAREPFVIPTE